MPLEQKPNNGVTVSIRDRRIIHVRDADVEVGISTTARNLVPLIRGDEAIGCIVKSELRTGGYTDSQIELLKTFAAQAVIAINSAETYRALQERPEALAHRNSEFGERIARRGFHLLSRRAARGRLRRGSRGLESLADRRRPARCGFIRA